MLRLPEKLNRKLTMLMNISGIKKTVSLLSWGLCLTAGALLVTQAQSVTEFETRRAALLEKFDENQDGRLDASERETMRKGKQKSLSKRGRSSRRGREPERHPKELLAKYDKDKSGWIDGKEWDVAGPTESAIIKKQFDANKNDELEDDEKEALLAAIKSQKIKGLYGGIAHHWLIRLAEEEEGPGYLKRQRRLLEFDADGDGLASPDELDAIRASLRQQKK